MAETISQRVNALFARYVAIEAEQIRLGNLGSKEADAEADALGTPALAVMDEIMSIRDRSGCVDLLAARILLDLMLGHRWEPEAGIEWSYDAATYSLPALEIMSSRLTGAVRVETRRALATIGVEVPEEAADPMLALITALREGEAKFDASCEPLSDEETDVLSAATWQPHYVALRDATPATTTLRGAAEGIRVVLKEEDGQMREDTFTVNVLRSVLSFLDGEAA